MQWRHYQVKGDVNEVVALVFVTLISVSGVVAREIVTATLKVPPLR